LVRVSSFVIPGYFHRNTSYEGVLPVHSGSHYVPGHLDALEQRGSLQGRYLEDAPEPLANSHVRQDRCVPEGNVFSIGALAYGRAK